MADGKIEYLIEVKNSDDSLSRSLKYFTESVKPTRSLQLVRYLKQDKDYGDVKVRSLISFLEQLEC